MEHQSKIQGYRIQHPTNEWIIDIQEKQNKLENLVNQLSLINNTDYEIQSYLDKGLLKFNEGKYEEAIKTYNLVLEKDPNNIVALTNKGNTLNFMANYQEALISLKKAIEKSPKYLPALLNIGTTYFLMGNYQESIIILDDILKIDPTNAIVFNNKAKALFALGKKDEAERCVKKAIELNPHLKNSWKIK